MCGSHQVPLDPGQAELLQTFCEDDSYDYPMIPDIRKQDQHGHGPSIENCGSDVMTGHKFLKTKSAMLLVFLDPPSLILFGIPNSLLLWTQLSFMQDLLTADTKFMT